MWKPEGKRPLGRPRRRWEDNIKKDLQDLGWGAWTGFTCLLSCRTYVCDALVTIEMRPSTNGTRVKWKLK